MTLEIDVSVEADDWSALGDLQDLVSRAIDGVLAETGQRLANGAEVSLVFCDDARIRELNEAWRKIDKPTNVLSFPAAAPDAIGKAMMLGDIVVAYETVERESRDEGKTLADHTRHMVVHGFLHLLGYDHEVEDDAERMEDTERRVLARLGVADPYAGTAPAGATT